MSIECIYASSMQRVNLRKLLASLPSALYRAGTIYSGQCRLGPFRNRSGRLSLSIISVLGRHCPSRMHLQSFFAPDSFLYSRPGAWPYDSLLKSPWPGRGPDRAAHSPLAKTASARVVRVPRARGHPTPPYARADHPPARKPMGPPRRLTVPERQ